MLGIVNDTRLTVDTCSSFALLLFLHQAIRDSRRSPYLDQNEVVLLNKPVSIIVLFFFFLQVHTA